MNTETPEEAEGPRVLLVDDKPENLRLLAEMLVERGYVVQVTRSGGQALKACGDRQPDIILLDVIMPTTDGFEVCRQLKQNPSTRNIPVIFVTAMAKTEEKVRGLELGGVDYVTKPIQLEEVAARISTQLELKRLRDALAEKVTELEDHNNRLTLFSKALAHDMRGAVHAIMGYSELLTADHSLHEAQQEQVGYIHQASQNLKEIIDSLLTLAVAEQTEHQELANVEASFKRATEGLEGVIQDQGARMVMASPLPPAPADPGWLDRVWTNLLSNAIKYGGKPPIVSVGGDETTEGEIRYWVEDNGAGLDPKQKEQLFTAFNRLQPEKAEGIGLGLVIVQKIVQQMGGHVGVEPGSTGGCRFFFTLPVKPPEG